MDKTAGRAARMALVIGMTAAVAACGDGREAVGGLLGLTGGSPDPFNVYPRGRLELPTDLASLPAPQPGARSPREPNPQAEAQAALGNIGAPAAAAGASAGEAALLANVGAETADPDIRTSLDDEELQREPQFGLKTFFGYKVPDGTEKDLLEGREEAKRLRLLGGATPTPPPEEVEDTSVLF